MAQSTCNRDIALKQFLKLLQWLRVVLVQDCALLHARYPQCSIFHFVLFTFPAFTDFSANVATLVTATEEKAQLAFHNLPDRIVQSMCGFATDLQMRQEQIETKMCNEFRDMREQNAHFKLKMLGTSKGLKCKTPSELCGLVGIPNC